MELCEALQAESQTPAADCDKDRVLMEGWAKTTTALGLGPHRPIWEAGLGS